MQNWNLAAKFPYMRQQFNTLWKCKIETWPPSFHLALLAYFALPVFHFGGSERSLAEFQKCTFSSHCNPPQHVFTFRHQILLPHMPQHAGSFNKWPPCWTKLVCFLRCAFIWLGGVISPSWWCLLKLFSLQWMVVNIVHGGHLFNPLVHILLDYVLRVVGIITNLWDSWLVRLSFLVRLLPSEWLV